MKCSKCDGRARYTVKHHGGWIPLCEKHYGKFENFSIFCGFGFIFRLLGLKK